MGTKKDLRENEEIKGKMKRVGMEPITREMGERLGEEIGAVGYREVSALTMEGVAEVFDLGLVISLGGGGGGEERREGGREGCVLC